ncbi:hypothetical protein JB92DRAFT_2974137 [Gautieria morchelliformis]|nr:hypothetical protein JB92DRAFT_2974137 [Gautieria morchelliformis]
MCWHSHSRAMSVVCSRRSCDPRAWSLGLRPLVSRLPMVSVSGISHWTLRAVASVHTEQREGPPHLSRMHPRHARPAPSTLVTACEEDSARRPSHIGTLWARRGVRDMQHCLRVCLHGCWCTRRELWTCHKQHDGDTLDVVCGIIRCTLPVGRARCIAPTPVHRGAAHA